MILKGKKGIILGVANRRSIAWAIAEKFHQEGGEFLLTYQNEKIGKTVKTLASRVGHCPTIVCDVMDDHQIDQVFHSAKQQFQHIDFLVHCIAYAPPQELKKPLSGVSRKGFEITTQVSAFSLTALAQRALPLMEKGGSIITLTSMGGWRIIPNYCVMGVAKAALEASIRYLASDLGTANIRVNGISPGPIRTVSAMGIRRFSQVLKHHKARSPLRKNAKASDTADVAVFLASDAASNVTGEIIFVDSGYHIVGI